jgi:hypothetical protein
MILIMCYLSTCNMTPGLTGITFSSTNEAFSMRDSRLETGSYETVHHWQGSHYFEIRGTKVTHNKYHILLFIGILCK